MIISAFFLRKEIAVKYSGIGGQAVMEGVMMKNQDEYAVAVRKPDGTIETKKENYKSIRGKYRLANIPIVRGVVSFVESLILGVKTLNYSASFFEEENPGNGENEEEKKEKKEKNDSILMSLVMIFAVVAAIGIFVLLPFFISEALRRQIPSTQLRGLLEGVIRVALFILYVKLITMMEDIKRVFMYHGAEHKSINCIENGCELTVENVRRQTTVHKRCGTSFMLLVMFVSILFFMFIAVGNIWLRMILRILLVPVIAGVSYEFIRYAGSHDNKAIHILGKPGLWLQSLTTAEPTDDMIEVAIASVETVFDWKEFMAATEEKPEEKPEEKREEKPKKKSKGVKEQPSQEIEILNIDDEEDDEILNALDRYFEAPKEKAEEK